MIWLLGGSAVAVLCYGCWHFGYMSCWKQTRREVRMHLNSIEEMRHRLNEANGVVCPPVEALFPNRAIIDRAKRQYDEAEVRKQALYRELEK